MVASDWIGQATQVQYSPCEIQALSKHIAMALEQQGAGTRKQKNTSTHKATQERIKVGKQNKVVYLSSRGNKCLKMDGKFVPLSKVLIR